MKFNGKLLIIGCGSVSQCAIPLVLKLIEMPPDKITIFQKPIEARCRGDTEIQREVQRVVKHEIAHHFGIGDARLNQLERKRRKP